MEIEEMMARLMAEIRTNREEMSTNHAKTDANLKEIIEDIKAWRKEMKADREATEAYPEKMEANPEEMKSVAVHEKVPEEEAIVETFGGLKERYGDRHLIVRRPGLPKKRNQASGGSRKKLATSCGRLTLCAILALCTGHCFQEQGKDKTVPRTRKGRKFGKRLRAKPEGINRIGDRDLKEQLQLGSERTSGKSLQEGSRAGDREEKSQAFSQDSKNE
jgi:hypothetical protein